MIIIEDLRKTGSVSLCDEPIWWDRMNDLKFKTPSRKIEIVSSRLEDNGFPSLKPYESPVKPKKGMFRLAFGRSPVHTHGTTQNNPYLNEIMSENTLWMNDQEATKLGIKNNDTVEVIAADGSHRGTIKVWVSEFTHPEVVYMAHGFGRKVPWQTRGYNKGLSDYRFETGMLYNYDPAGGGIALLEAMVQVKKAS